MSKKSCSNNAINVNLHAIQYCTITISMHILIYCAQILCFLLLLILSYPQALSVLIISTPLLPVQELFLSQPKEIFLSYTITIHNTPFPHNVYYSAKQSSLQNASSTSPFYSCQGSWRDGRHEHRSRTGESIFR